MPEREPNDAERGLTLIELMVSVVVFWVGMLGAYALMMSVINATRDAGEISMASNLAVAEMERLSVTNYNSIIGSNSTYYDRWGQSNGSPTYYTVTWSATAGTDPRYTDVSVAVAWDSNRSSMAMQSRVYPR